MELTELTQDEREAVAETKAIAQRVKATLPEVMLKGNKSRQPRHKGSTSSDREAEAAKQIEASYDQLEGVWREYLDELEGQINDILKQVGVEDLSGTLLRQALKIDTPREDGTWLKSVFRQCFRHSRCFAREQ